jgi:predicted metal-dependent hydrolase
MWQQVLPFFDFEDPDYMPFMEGLKRPSWKGIKDKITKKPTALPVAEEKPAFVLNKKESPLPVQCIYSGTRKSASGRRVPEGFSIQVPKRWSKTQEVHAVSRLLQRLNQQEEKRHTLLNQAKKQPLLTLHTKAELSTYATELNQSTLNSPVKGFSVGSAKHSRLAQVNLKTGIITVSKYCMGQMPEQAFRYLLLHELTHFYHGGHGADFWQKVRQFCLDARTQHHLMAAWHQQQTLEQDPAYVAYEAN